MTSGMLWWMLLAFTLGFAASTLWEWLYFRQRRRSDAAQRIAELEAQLQQTQRAPSASVQERVTSPQEAAPPPAADDKPHAESISAEFTSPAALLDSEQRLASAPAPTYRPPSAAPEEGAGEAIEPFKGFPREQTEGVDQSFAVEQVTRTQPALQPKYAPVIPVPPEQPTVSDIIWRPVEETPSPRDEWSTPPAELERKKAAPYPDNLVRIPGIGKRYQDRLYAAGIFTWHQLAEISVDDLRAITRAQPNADIAGWIEHARKLMQQHGREGAIYSGPIPDDFTELRGIGPATMQALYNAGIYTYAQLAQTSVDRLAQVFPTPSIGDGFDFAGWIRAAADRVHEHQT